MNTPTHRPRRLRRVVPLIGAAALIASLAAVPTATAGSSTPVVAGGLDNPRQLSFNGKGDLFVAEAGRGGSGP